LYWEFVHYEEQAIKVIWFEFRLYAPGRIENGEKLEFSL